jgi:hypothetical protein
MNSLFEKCVNIDWDNIWKELDTRTIYRAECDDVGGLLDVSISPDGDVHVMMHDHPRAEECGGHFGSPAFRARTYIGGGHQYKVREALIMLALAIKEETKHD